MSELKYDLFLWLLSFSLHTNLKSGKKQSVLFLSFSFGCRLCLPSAFVLNGFSGPSSFHLACSVLSILETIGSCLKEIIASSVRSLCAMLLVLGWFVQDCTALAKHLLIEAGVKICLFVHLSVYSYSVPCAWLACGSGKVAMIWTLTKGI